MTEYSPLPGTLRSNTREVTDEPCTKKTTGRAGSPGFGAPSRLRYIHNGTSPFLVQYSLLQISPPSLCAGDQAEAGALDQRAARKRMCGLGHGFTPNALLVASNSNSGRHGLKAVCA